MPARITRSPTSRGRHRPEWSGSTWWSDRRLNTPGLGEDKPADYLERVNREHEDIYKAILRRDPEAARAAMRTHLSNSRERLREAQQRLQDQPASPAR